MRENSPGRAVGQFQNRYPGRTGVGDCAGSNAPRVVRRSDMTVTSHLVLRPATGLPHVMVDDRGA